MRRTLLILAVFLSVRALAAYRVYQLLVTRYDVKGKPVHREVVLTNLDAEQWGSYHGTDDRLRVEMQDTWYCPGDTAGRDYCSRPKLGGRQPAGLVHPSRVELH